MINNCTLVIELDQGYSICNGKSTYDTVFGLRCEEHKNIGTVKDMLKDNNLHSELMKIHYCEQTSTLNKRNGIEGMLFCREETFLPRFYTVSLKEDGFATIYPKYKGKSTLRLGYLAREDCYDITRKEYYRNCRNIFDENGISILRCMIRDGCNIIITGPSARDFDSCEGYSTKEKLLASYQDKTIPYCYELVICLNLLRTDESEEDESEEEITLRVSIHISSSSTEEGEVSINEEDTVVEITHTNEEELTSGTIAEIILTTEVSIPTIERTDVTTSISSQDSNLPVNGETHISNVENDNLNRDFNKTKDL